jgi:hypothetical protein
MLVTRLPLIVVAMGVAVLSASSASAQVFGTFPWQMQPSCNRVTLTLTNAPAGFALDGVDDLCGATDKGSAVGVASLNASGNVTLSFTIVTAPTGKSVHVSAVVSPATGSGTWTDSAGHSGVFAFFGAASGLPARPLDLVQFRVEGQLAHALPSVARTDLLWATVVFNDGAEPTTARPASLPCRPRACISRAAARRAGHRRARAAGCHAADSPGEAGRGHTGADRRHHRRRALSDEAWWIAEPATDSAMKEPTENFETNDLAILKGADGWLSNANVRYRETQPGRVLRNYEFRLDAIADLAPTTRHRDGVLVPVG